MKTLAAILSLMIGLGAAHAASRALSANEQAALSVKSTAPVHRIELYHPLRCRECMRYAEDIADALRDSGWKTETLGANPPLSNASGVVVFVADPANLTAASKELTAKLTAAAIPYTVEKMEIGNFVIQPKLSPRGDILPGEKMTVIPKDAIIWIGR